MGTMLFIAMPLLFDAMPSGNSTAHQMPVPGQSGPVIPEHQIKSSDSAGQGRVMPWPWHLP